jgi:hypothetical protein
MMLIAYMDETGHSKDELQKFNGMAGFLAAPDRWRELEARWKATLENKEFKLPHFHMREFEARDAKGNTLGFYKGWSEAKRRRLYSKLMRHIHNAVALPIGAVIAMEDWRALTDFQQKLLHGDPYFLTYQNVIAYATSYLEVMQVPEEVKIGFIFGDHVEFRHRALKLYEEIERIGKFIKRSACPPEFEDMRDEVPLQAADLLAYEMYKEHDRRRYRPHHKPRWGYNRIMEMTQKHQFVLSCRFYSTVELKEYAESTERAVRTKRYWESRRNGPSC